MEGYCLKKALLKYFLVAGFFLLIGFFKAYHLPDFKLWAINQIELISRNDGPARVLVSDIDFKLFPIGVHFNNIRIYPKKDLEEFIEPIFLKSFQVSLNPLSFLTGLFQFSRVEFVQPLIRVKSPKRLLEFLKRDSGPSTFQLKNILRIPLNNFTIRNMELSIPPEGDIPTVNLQKFSIDIENQKTSALISIFSPHIMIYDPKISESPATISIGSRILVFDDQLLLSALKIKKGSSYVLASGYLDTPITHIKFEDYLLKIKTNFYLEEFKKEIQPFLRNVDLPEMRGRNQSLLTISKKAQAPMSIDYRFRFQNLGILQFDIGEAIGKVAYQNDQLISNQIEIRNSAGILKLKKVNVQLTPDFKYSVTLDASQLQIQEVLKHLGLGEVPVQILASADLPCTGDIKAKIYANCKGSIDISKLRVYNSKLDIVSIEKAKLQGEVTVHNEAVVIKSDIQVGTGTSGAASGSVSYSKGFQFEYQADSLNFQDFKIANLGLEGKSKIKGKTEGTSHAATFNFDIKALDFWISDFFLGDIMSNVSYKKGNLNLAKVDGLVRATKYLGNIQVDLSNTEIKGSIQSPYIELSDLKNVFSRKTTLPFEFYGGGEAKAEFSGPLDFPTMKYHLESKILNGNLANESFDNLTFNVTSNGKIIRIDQAVLNKGTAQLAVTGFSNSHGIIQTKWMGKDFTLQNINNFSRTELNIDGHLDFDLELKGPILSPDSLFKGNLSNTTISQEKVADSKFELIFKKNSIDGTGDIFGDQIRAEFKIPLTEESPFLLNAQLKKWDFVPLIHLISSRSRAAEFSTLLTADINIQSKNDFLWNANGYANIKEFKIQRGSKELHLQQPTNIDLKNGKPLFDRMILTGDNTSLDIFSSEKNQYPVFFNINGKIDLGLLSFLTPFFDDLKGTAALTTQYALNKSGWSLFGSAYLTNGSIRIPDFPHSVENIEADLLFSEDKVIINKLTSQFASGRINANGNLEIKGLRNIKTDIYGKFKDINLLVPKDINTKGSGDFHITGKWFPYLMEGNYIIQSGTLTKDFSNNEQTKTSYTREQLLPQEFNKEVKDIVIFNFDTIFSKGIDIKNELINSKVYGKLKIKGPPANSILLGQVQLQRNGKIYFKDTEFEVEIADIKFNDPNKLNPELYISANTVVTESLDNTTQRYDINMLIQGKTNNPTINLTSNPPRSDKDIISLLALGVTTESYQTAEDSQIAKQSYEVGASILTKNKFGRDLKERTGLEFKVSSALDQTNNSASPKVTISKQWTPTIETSASRTFGESTTNDLKVEYQLNRNISLIGSWEGREISNTNLNKDSNDKTTTDILGLDIEYKVEFK